MGELWERIKDYGEVTGRYLSSTREMTNTEYILLLVFFVSALLAITYFSSATHEERQVSRRKQRSKHLQQMDEAQQAITEALEARRKAGKLDAKFIDERLYPMLAKAGLKEVGPEPTFGKPWYTPSKKMPDLGKVKRGIHTRLHQMGVDVATKLKRRPKPSKTEELRLALKLPPKKA